MTTGSGWFNFSAFQLNLESKPTLPDFGLRRGDGQPAKPLEKKRRRGGFADSTPERMGVGRAGAAGPPGFTEWLPGSPATPCRLPPAGG